MFAFIYNTALMILRVLFCTVTLGRLLHGQANIRSGVHVAIKAAIFVVILGNFALVVTMHHLYADAAATWVQNLHRIIYTGSCMPFHHLHDPTAQTPVHAAIGLNSCLSR